MPQRSDGTSALVVLAVVCFVLSGCMTTLAVVTSPASVKLQPLPDRHYRLAVDVDLDGQRRTIEYTWKCTHERGFSAAVGWTLYWQPAGGHGHYVVRQIDSNVVVFFRLPPVSYACLESGQARYTPDVGVIPDPPRGVTPYSPRLDKVIVYRASDRCGGAVLSGTIERLDREPKVTGLSPDELHLAELLRSNQNDLKSAVVTITPESIWGRYPMLKDYFGRMTELTLAPLPTPQRGSYGFPIFSDVRLDTNDSCRRLRYSVEDVNGTIATDSSRSTEHWTVYRFDRRDFRRKVTFCHSDLCVPMRKQSDDFYFPNTRSVIKVFHSISLRNNMH